MLWVEDLTIPALKLATFGARAISLGDTYGGLRGLDLALDLSAMVVVGVVDVIFVDVFAIVVVSSVNVIVLSVVHEERAASLVKRHGCCG